MKDAIRGLERQGSVRETGDEGNGVSIGAFGAIWSQMVQLVQLNLAWCNWCNCAIFSAIIMIYR